ncbi:hypothetical protein Oscil6304_5575 [Oscillatoria acuminata PCC 6304]|uniref:Uncharacterized protein n=1 Tax=Oscillatoria acuminata PCC 6304 TaxID=56110 RepID=K9TRM0_9CYAN|nr:hypothetical protein Oscil6304_5575 [Oscillatoria acuminata PCC 6304]
MEEMGEMGETAIEMGEMGETYNLPFAHFF